jgi:hypothetical protein
VNSRAEALGYKTRSAPGRFCWALPNGFRRDTCLCLHKRVSYPTLFLRPLAGNESILRNRLENSVRTSEGNNVAHYTIRPTHRHSTTSPHSGLYALPSLCARLRRLGDPRVVPCFRWHPFSTCRPPGPREAQRLHIPSSFAADAGLRLKGKVSALPTSPHSDSRGGVQFRGFTTVRFRCDLSICSPSCRS